jgi:hypothetical protein
VFQTKKQRQEMEVHSLLDKVCDFGQSVALMSLPRHVFDLIISQLLTFRTRSVATSYDYPGSYCGWQNGSG